MTHSTFSPADQLRKARLALVALLLAFAFVVASPQSPQAEEEADSAEVELKCLVDSGEGTEVIFVYDEEECTELGGTLVMDED